MPNIEVGGRTYVIKGVPLWVQPLLRYYGVLVGKIPQSVEEAVKLATEQQELLTKLFSYCLEPSDVRPEDAAVLVMRILDETNRIDQEVAKMISLFRGEQQQQQGSSKSG